MGKVHEELHRLVDYLPEEQAGVVKRLVELLIEKDDIDPDPLTPEEEAALQRAREQVARGETVPLEDLERELDREV